MIAYEQQGSGPALIIVDGAMSTRGGKAALRALLAPQLTVFGYDRRGRGATAAIRSRTRWTGRSRTSWR